MTDSIEETLSIKNTQFWSHQLICCTITPVQSHLYSSTCSHTCTVTPVHLHMYIYTCTITPVVTPIQSHLYNHTYTVTSVVTFTHVQSYLYNHTCTITPVQSHRYSFTCTITPVQLHMYLLTTCVRSYRQVWLYLVLASHPSAWHVFHVCLSDQNKQSVPTLINQGILCM